MQEFRTIKVCDLDLNLGWVILCIIHQLLPIIQISLASEKTFCGWMMYVYVRMGGHWTARPVLLVECVDGVKPKSDVERILQLVTMTVRTTTQLWWLTYSKHPVHIIGPIF